jgi:hypothetical protein
MTIEHAHAHFLPKPWGVVDLRPWSNAGDDANTIGEIWYERSDTTAAPPSLPLKLLFTNQSLSIQVHPNDATGDAIFAQSDHVNLRAGRDGLAGLVAYTGRLVPELLKCVDMETTQ